MELINADRLTVELDFSVMFQDLEEICSRPFCLFYWGFFCSVPNFPVLLAFFFFWEKPCEAVLCPAIGGCCGGASPGPRTLLAFVLGMGQDLPALPHALLQG